MTLLTSVFMLVSMLTTGCGGGASDTPAPSPTQSGIAISLSGGTLRVVQQASGSVDVTVNRTGNTGIVTLSATGLPSGASIAFEQPGSGSGGKVTISAGEALSGDYSVTIVASDGTHQASSALAVKVSLKPAMSGPLHWSSTGPLISVIPDANHPIVAVKDPSIVYCNNTWHVFATAPTNKGAWSMVYLNFTDWSQSANAKQYYMADTPGYGVHAAPEVFYFRPHNKWYLISEWGPQYSTNDDISKPEAWTPPQDLFAAGQGVPNWLDYWIICDAKNCYLFATNDAGDFFRSQTTIENFPHGWSNPVLVMHAANRGDLFEGSNTYKIKGTNQYLTLIEAASADWSKRYFRGWIADRLDGNWTPLPSGNDWTNPFIGLNNVTFDTGVRAWTVNFSHGEMIRDGYDETLTIDPNNLQFLYQGVDVNDPPTSDYSQIPWRLGLVRKTN